MRRAASAIPVEGVGSVVNWWIQDLNTTHCDREAIVSGLYL